MHRVSKRRSNLYIKKHPYKLFGAFLLAAVLVLAVLELTGVTHIFHKTPVPPVIPVDSSSNQPNTLPQSSPQSSGSKDNKSGDSSSSQVKLPLYSPYGNFVSNHHPNLNGSPAPSQETSVCNTTPGAKCYVKFTMGSTHTSLPVKTADSKGSVFWSWDVRKAGLTVGDWTITAVATLNGQSKSVQDPLPLSVSKWSGFSFYLYQFYSWSLG